MKIPEEILILIRNEQASQNGNFIPDEKNFFKKLSDKAELVVHNSSIGCSGFVFFYCNDPLNFSSFITLLMVAPDARKNGIGAALVHYVLTLTKQKNFSCCRLEVKKENIAAVSLYQSMGFQLIEDRDGKYLMEAPAG